MFHQLLTPVGGNLRLVVSGRGSADRDGAGDAWGIAPPRLAGLARRPCRRLRDRHADLAVPGRAGASTASRAGVVFALWPVMWIVFNALLLYNIAVAFRPLRRLPRLGSRPPAERPADRAGGHRLLLRLPAGGHLRFWHPGRDHQRPADPGRLSGAGGADLHADFQHRAGRVRRAWRPDHRAGAGHRPARGDARRHGRPATAVYRGAAAVLRHGDLWRGAVGAGAVAGAAGRRRQLCAAASSCPRTFSTMR